MTRNQTSITGPKARPMRAVPCGWTRNKATSTATESGRTYGVTEGAVISSPSKAERTEIAGVMAPSP